MMVSGSQVVNNQTLSFAKQSHALIYALLNCFNFACLKQPLVCVCKHIKRSAVSRRVSLKVGRFEIVWIRVVGRVYCFLDSAHRIVVPPNSPVHFSLVHHDHWSKDQDTDTEEQGGLHGGIWWAALWGLIRLLRGSEIFFLISPAPWDIASHGAYFL